MFDYKISEHRIQKIQEEIKPDTKIPLNNIYNYFDRENIDRNKIKKDFKSLFNYEKPAHKVFLNFFNSKYDSEREKLIIHQIIFELCRNKTNHYSNNIHSASPTASATNSQDNKKADTFPIKKIFSQDLYNKLSEDEKVLYKKVSFDFTSLSPGAKHYIIKNFTQLTTLDAVDLRETNITYNDIEFFLKYFPNLKDISIRRFLIKGISIDKFKEKHPKIDIHSNANIVNNKKDDNKIVIRLLRPVISCLSL